MNDINVTYKVKKLYQCRFWVMNLSFINNVYKKKMSYQISNLTTKATLCSCFMEIRMYRLVYGNVFNCCFCCNFKAQLKVTELREFRQLLQCLNQFNVGRQKNVTRASKK